MQSAVPGNAGREEEKRRTVFLGKREKQEGMCRREYEKKMADCVEEVCMMEGNGISTNKTRLVEPEEVELCFFIFL